MTGARRIDDDVPVPRLTWVYAIYQDTTSLKRVSSMKLHRALGVTQKTARREAFAMQRPEEFAGRKNLRDLDTLRQMVAATCSLAGRSLKYHDLIAENGLPSGARET